MIHLGCPIVGDTDSNFAKNSRIGAGKGLFLASLATSFAHPRTAKRMDIERPEPPKFEALRSREAGMHQRKRAAAAGEEGVSGVPPSKAAKLN